MAARKISVLVATLVVAACSGSAQTPSSTPVAATASGSVGAILAGDAAAGRYKDFRAQLQVAFGKAGFEYRIDETADQLAQAQADIAAGASVIVIDAVSDDVGAQVAAYARAHGAKVVTFDRPIFAGTGNYHVTFDAVQAGTLIGQGFMRCVSDWKVKDPKVFVLDGGEDTDPNAVALAKGYNQVLWGDSTTPQMPGKTNNAGYTLIGDQIAKGWDVASGARAFKAHFTAHREINATLEASDSLGNAVIQVLKAAGVKPNTVPVTGYDATLQGIVNVVQGYQCGTVYRPLDREAQTIATLARTLLAGGKLSGLIKGTVNPRYGVAGKEQPVVLATSVWVTKANVEATVLKDGFVDRAALCGVLGAATCQANNIPAY